MSGRNDVLKQLLGKTIKSIVVRHDYTGHTKPATQLVLVFTDDTSFELYSDYNISFASGLDKGGIESALKYVKSTGVGPDISYNEFILPDS